MVGSSDAYKILCDQINSSNVDIGEVEAKLKAQHVETPSWGYGNSGTRFKVFPWEGAARNVYEKLEDAAFIHKLSGISSSVALHVVWDRTDDWSGLKDYAKQKGITIGAINPNVFQDEAYKLGSVCHPNEVIRQQAVNHFIECCEIMRITGSDILSVWLADGTNYPGQDDFRQRKHRMEGCFREVYSHLPDGSRMLIEYKFFEPAFYQTDIPDWGMAYNLCLKLGPQAQVLVDTGHHALGTNVAHIVSILLDEKRLGGFHLNSRQYADDDLIVGSTNSWEIFDIYHQLVSAGPLSGEVAFMLDQSHNIESKLEAMLLSVINCQVAFAKALIVDYKALSDAQMNEDVLRGHCILKDAFETDVRPLLEKVREEMDVPRDPMRALREDPYLQLIVQERGIDVIDGGGYPN